MESLLRPKEQEVFRSTEWKRYQVDGKSKTKKGYVNGFEIYTRVVDTSEKVTGAEQGQMTSQNISSSQKSLGNPLFMQGAKAPYGKPIDFPHPLAPKEQMDINFEQLPSILAARKENKRFNIGFDCEYQSVGKRKRIILSYQFAFYLPDNVHIMEVVFITTNPTVENRLYLRTCLGVILEICESDHLVTAICKQSRRMQYEAETVKQLPAVIQNRENEENALVVIDKSNCNKEEGEEKHGKLHFNIIIVSHAGIVDLTAFKKDKTLFDKDGSLLPYLKSVQGGMVSIYEYDLDIPKPSRYWCYYPVWLTFRDSMCYAPASGKSLEQLGASIQVPKIKLPENVIENMLLFMQEHPEDFLAYAAQDALVTIMYGSRLWGINKEWCITATAGSAYAIKNTICNYMGIPKMKNGKYDNREFNRIYRGMETVSRGKVSTPRGLRTVTETVSISYEREQLYRFASGAYCGGFNTSCRIGVYKDLVTYDYDLCGAYCTAMCLIFDIDYDNPLEREFKNEELSLQAFRTPVDPLFALVDFEFPLEVSYPCIPIHHEGSIIFPRKGEKVYASGPSLFLALKLGATVHIRYGYMGRLRYRNTKAPTGFGIVLEPSMSLRAAMKQLAVDRDTAKLLYGKGSMEEQLLKLFSNGGYGKISQNVIEKHTWNGWTEEMEDLGVSSITCPEKACLITDIIRCTLLGTMNQLEHLGYKNFSATTDGFISDVPLSVLLEQDAFGFIPLLCEARNWLVGVTDNVWEIKHAQDFLVNPTTRCNTGFGYGGYEGVNAHGGYATGEIKDSFADRLAMFRAVTGRTGRLKYKVTEFMNAKTISKKNADFCTYEVERNIRLDFDMKRRPVKDSFKEVQDIYLDVSYEYMNFETEPFDSIEEYEKYRKVNSTFQCLRTQQEWNLFWLKLSDKETGKVRQLGDLEWTKLFSVVMGHRLGMWHSKELEECQTVKDKLLFINSRNHSNRTFTLDNWKDCRKEQRKNQMLPREMLEDMLLEFGINL